MLVRYADWKRPTDAAYAFHLRPLEALAPALPPAGTRSDIRQVAREALAPGEAERFEAQVQRWDGPEDEVGPAGERPYALPQLGFEEAGAPAALSMAHVDRVLRGVALVLRTRAGQVDYVLRDHHMLDVVLYHYRTRGELPRALFHADRHSDWCRDGFLAARRPQQAATWWALLEGLKRPGSAAPVLGERDVHFTTAAAAHTARMSGRDVGASTRVPPFLDPDALGWEHVLAQPGALEADWVSLDLDYFQPAAQLALVRGLVRAPRFHALLRTARVRTFVLSPQFTNGGDRVEPWVVQGSLPSSLRLLNLLRGLPGRSRPAGAR